jgi:hypothetical protein
MCIFMPKRYRCGCDIMSLIQCREEYSSIYEFVRAAVLICGNTIALIIVHHYPRLTDWLP